MKINWKKVLHLIPKDKQKEIKQIIITYYLELMEDDWPVVLENDILRWRSLSLVNWGHWGHGKYIDYNAYLAKVNAGIVPQWEYRASMRASGYSLAGYSELDWVQNWVDENQQNN